MLSRLQIPVFSRQHTNRLESAFYGHTYLWLHQNPKWLRGDLCITAMFPTRRLLSSLVLAIVVPCLGRYCWSPCIVTLTQPHAPIMMQIYDRASLWYGPGVLIFSKTLWQAWVFLLLLRQFVCHICPYISTSTCRHKIVSTDMGSDIYTIKAVSQDNFEDVKVPDVVNDHSWKSRNPSSIQ